MALGANVPLAMRGPAEVASWSPTKIAALDEETLARITDLYARDPLLSRRLADALESDAIASEAHGGRAGGSGGRCVHDDERCRGARREGEAQLQRALRGNGARRGGISQARRRSARRDVRHHGLGHACERGRCARAARAAPAGSRCGAGGVEGVARARVAQYRGAGRHRVRPYRRHQRHARHGSRHGRRRVPVRRRGRGRTRASPTGRALRARICSMHATSNPRATCAPS